MLAVNKKSLSFFSSQTKSFSSLYPSSSSSPLSPQSSNITVALHYLINTFHLSKPKALSILTDRKRVFTPENPQSILTYFRDLGFSELSIQSIVRANPRVIFSKIDKTLKPKLDFFQHQLGIVGPDLGKLVSTNPSLLSLSLERKLIPGIKILKGLLLDDSNNTGFIMAIRRCPYLFIYLERLLQNIEYLQSCGIVGSQLAYLLKRQPRLLVGPKSALRDLVSRVLEMGFEMKSRMLVHALHSLSCVSVRTLGAKVDMFYDMGFTKDEVLLMFRRTPGLIRTSLKKLRIGAEFYMKTVKLSKAVIVSRPVFLLSSMEERIVPRFRVLQVLRLKNVLKKVSFFHLLSLKESVFLEKYVFRFEDYEEALLIAYRGEIVEKSTRSS